MFFRLFKGTIIAYSIIRKAKPDLVYVNEYVLIQFAIAAKLQKITAVTHIRSQFLRGTIGFRKKLLSKILLKCNEKIFAITPQEANQIIVKSINQKNKIIVVPEFLNDENFRKNYPLVELKKTFGINESKKIIVMLGGIEKVKGTYELIEAIGLLKKELPTIFLVIAGNFDMFPSNLKYWERCQKLMDIYNLKDDIKILPPLQDANHLIAIADIVVSSSIMSHFSRPVIEAWAKMKPIIAARSIHSVEYIEDGINGLLYDPTSPEELKEKIKMILVDSTLRLHISENGHKKAQAFYNGRINTKIIIDEVHKFLHK
jgi:glycosyltransferase involved in cell wall biosynthesis